LINILAIRTHYPQWASRSGIVQYLKYLDKRFFTVSEQLVTMGDDAFPKQIKPINNVLKKMLRLKKKSNYIYDINDFFAELSVLRKTWTEKIDIIQYLDPEHSLQYLPGWLGPLSIKKEKPIVVAMFHQTKSVLKDIISPKLARNLDHIILMSSEQKEFFSNDVDEKKISVILHGIDTDYYQPDYTKKRGSKFKCVTVGHWLRDYDALEMVAASLLDRDFIEFHIVSNVRLKHDLKNIIIHKHISDRELLDLYQQANLLFMPFKDATANNAILEGMACGLPVLTTDLIATREYVKDADAFFVGNNSIDEFRQHIIAVARVCEKNRLYGEQSRRRALELSWPNITKQYTELYSELNGRREIRK
jgi:glycosyltransferase involved in cell wall biosynthesis